MAGRLMVLVGFGAGYVFGTRAGRERYEQMAGKVQGLWNDPRIQEKAGQARQVVKERAGNKASGDGSGLTSGTSAAGGIGEAGTSTGLGDTTESGTSTGFGSRPDSSGGVSS